MRRPLLLAALTAGTRAALNGTEYPEIRYRGAAAHLVHEFTEPYRYVADDEVEARIESWIMGRFGTGAGEAVPEDAAMRTIHLTNENARQLRPLLEDCVHEAIVFPDGKSLLFCEG